LRELREDYAAEEDSEGEEVLHENFYWRILGGRWTAKHKNKPADAASMFGRAHARAWCDLHQWPYQKGFAFALYGEADAVHLAKAWARKSDYFSSMWFDNGASPDFEYSQEQLDSYTETDSFLDWAIALDVESPCFDRVIDVRAAFPLKRPVSVGGGPAAA